jgi:hypothetical protein
LGDGPPSFRRNFTCSAVLRIHSGENESFNYRVVTFSDGPFQIASSTPFFYHSVLSVLQPQEASLLVWALPVSLAATQGIEISFSSSRYLDVSVPWVCLPYPMNSGKDPLPLRRGGFPIRKSPDQSLLTAPRSISVLVPSFIGS